MSNELENLDKIIEGWADPITKFIQAYDNAHGDEIARQFLLPRQDFKPHFLDTLFGLTKDTRYQAKKFAKDYLFSGKTPYHTGGSGIRGHHPEGIALEVYEVIDKLPDALLEVEEPRVAAGYGICVGNTLVSLFTVTALDMGEMPNPKDRAQFVLNKTKKWANSVIEYFQKKDPNYREKLTHCFKNTQEYQLPFLETKMLNSPR